MVEIYGLPLEFNAKRYVRVIENSVTRDNPLHMHEYFELEMVLCGKCKQLLNGETYNDISRGTVYFLSPVDFHKLYDIEENVKVINVCFENKFGSSAILGKLTNRTNNIILQLDESEIRWFEKVTALLAESIETNDEFSERDVKNILESLLIYILRKLKRSGESENTDEISPIQKSMKYLFAHYRENPSLKEVADVSGYSENYFCKKFKELTGKTYVDFLSALKLNYAKIMLLTSKATIIEIAEACGFTSVSNFNRVFREELGMSPSDFIKINKIKKSCFKY